MNRRIRDHGKPDATRNSRAAACSAAAHEIALAPTDTTVATMRSQAPGFTAQLTALLRASVARLRKLLQRRRPARKLQLLEMQQLGEKRFIAIVRVGRQKFLIGGAASSVLLLAEIGSHKTNVLTPRPLNQESA